MGWLGEAWRRLAFLLGRGRFEQDLDEEMRFHLEMKARKNREAGVAADEAEYAARRRFGNMLSLRERSSDAWGWSWLERLAQDVRYALRMMRRSPGFTAVAMLVLALGIGVNSAVFSALNGLLLNPYPFPHAERLMEIASRHESHTSGRWSSTVLIREYFDYREQNAVFEEMGAYIWTKRTLTGQSMPGLVTAERITGGEATAGFLKVLGIEPALGRFFSAEEDRPGGSPVVVLSHAMWQTRFGGRPDILGQTLTLAGKAHTIIGVLPARFALPGTYTCEFWLPAALDPATGRGTRMDNMTWIARLKPGVSRERAQADMNVIASRLAAQYPADDGGWRVLVRPANEALADEARTLLLLLGGGVGLVLLIVCTNVAGLMLARNAGRAREIAIRASLGACRSRLVRQMLAESLMLSLPGGVLGLLAAEWLIRLGRRAAPAYMGIDAALRLDGHVLTFALAASLATGILFGLAPAFHASRVDLNVVMKGGADARGGLRARNRFLAALVVAEVALACVLLTGGGLLMKGFLRLLRVDLGVRTEHVLTFQLTLPEARYGSDARRIEFYDRLLERMRSLPGVLAVGAVSALPMSNYYSGGGFQIEGRPAPKRWQDLAAQYCSATPGYFQSMGIATMRGREFTDTDRRGSEGVVIINQVLARQFFRNEDPIGQRLKELGPIVGVVGSVRHGGPEREPGPQIYVPMLRSPGHAPYVAVRTAGDPLQLARAVRAEVRALDRDMPVDRLRTMEQVVSEALSIPRTMTVLAGGFGVFALVLAAIGIYGMIAYSVTQRTHEIGIRVALGAAYFDVLLLMVRRGLLLTLAGAAIGSVGALAASRVLASMLSGVSPRDVVVFASVPVVLILTALAASYLPARRAARVDPLVALRCD